MTEGDHVKSGQPLVRLSSVQARSRLIERRPPSSRLVSSAVRPTEPLSTSTSKQLQAQAILVARKQARSARQDIKHVEELAGDDVLPNERLLMARDIQQIFSHRSRPKNSNCVNSNCRILARRSNWRTRPFISPRHGSPRPKSVSSYDRCSDGGNRAPGATIRRTVTGPAQMIPAIWFVADKPRIVRCEIDQAFADRVHVGMRAEVFDDRVAGQRWIGQVQRCGDRIAQRRSLLDEPFQK